MRRGFAIGFVLLLAVGVAEARTPCERAAELDSSLDEGPAEKDLAVDAARRVCGSLGFRGETPEDACIAVWADRYERVQHGALLARVMRQNVLACELAEVNPDSLEFGACVIQRTHDLTMSFAIRRAEARAACDQ